MNLVKYATLDVKALEAQLSARPYWPAKELQPIIGCTWLTVQRTPGLTVPPVGKPNVGWPWKVVFDVIVARQALVEEAKLRAGGLAPGLYACGDVRIVYAMLRRWAAEERKDP